MSQIQQQKQALLTGMFIVVGTLGLILSLFLSGEGLPFMNSKVKIYTELTQSQGIASGSLVSLNGVIIGNVESIQISPQDIRKIRVQLQIQKKFDNKIPVDSIIELKTQGALGDRYLYITPGVSENSIQQEGFIQAKNSKDLLDILSEKGSEAQKIFYLIDETLTLLKSFNENQRVAHILQNTQEATLEIKSLSKEIKNLATQFNQNERETLSSSLKKMDSIFSKIDKGEGTLGALINDKSIHHQMKQILGRSPSREHLESLYQKSLNFNKKSSSDSKN